MRATHSPSADPGDEAGLQAGDPDGSLPAHPVESVPGRQPGLARLALGRRFLPRTFQGRLTLGFVGVIALVLVLVSALALNRLDDYFAAQEQQNLQTRTVAVVNILKVFIEREAGTHPIVGPDNKVNADVATLMTNDDFVQPLADQIAQADLIVRLGSTTQGPDGTRLVPSPGATYVAHLLAQPLAGQTREAIGHTVLVPISEPLRPWALEVTLSNPYTYRATTINDLTVLLALVALVALVVSLALAALMARRFTTPLRRLTDVSRVIAAGDLSARVPASLSSAGTVEIAALSRQFNAMAEQLEGSVEIIRRDRDRSREFLADVSHELRTPIAALRTFIELLREGAGDDPVARAEFLESSGQQLERLDWLAQNLLELSKLDSGLVLLDLRPDDLRTAVESAVEQAEAAARKRGVALSLHVPGRPVRLRHDPQRVGQVVSNLVGNALKFTPRGGAVTVELERFRDGALVRVSDTGVGIDAAELPRIFDRFYRGTRASEARGSGSGLGLAIVRSIVDMHHGRITVESGPSRGSVFTVYLPHDPRGGTIEPPAEPSGVASGDGAGVPPVPGTTERSPAVTDATPARTGRGLSGKPPAPRPD